MNPTAEASRPGRPRGRPGSLFFRLMAVMIVTVVVTLVLLATFFRTWWSPDARESTRTNLRQYAELLSREIGTPPDFERAGYLSDTLRLGIAIRDPSGQWWFSQRVPEPVRDRILAREQGFDPANAPPPWHLGPKTPPPPPRPPHGPDSARVHWRKGRMVAVVPLNHYTFVYGSRRRQPFESSLQEWALLFGGLAAAWFFAWLFLRRQMQPVRDLARGVRDVEAGHLDTRIPEKGSTELAELAGSFNEMTRSLRERLKARDQLLLDVSHELRSPLTRMRVALEMAEPGSAVDSLREEVEALESMLSELLETERLKSQAGGVRRVPGDLGLLLADYVARFEYQAPGIVLDAEKVPPVPMDEERIRLVLRNILENALKHGRGATEPVRVGLRASAGLAVITVRDRGPGVLEEEQRLIFEPFYRTDRSRTGTPGYGLGLPLCKRVVEAHGGTISFASRPGEGTTVTIRLPLS